MAKKEPDNLSQDAAAARAAGMSYGKWKGLQPVVPVEPKMVPGYYTGNVCNYCGNRFYSSDRKQKSCSRKCAALARLAARHKKTEDGRAAEETEALPQVDCT